MDLARPRRPAPLAGPAAAGPGGGGRAGGGFGMRVPAIRTAGGEARGASEGRPVDPASVDDYLRRAFGTALPAVRVRWGGKEPLRCRSDPAAARASSGASL